MINDKILMINGWGFGFDSRLNFNIVEVKIV